MFAGAIFYVASLLVLASASSVFSVIVGAGVLVGIGLGNGFGGRLTRDVDSHAQSGIGLHYRCGIAWCPFVGADCASPYEPIRVESKGA
jgi:hypothetical protein